MSLLSTASLTLVARLSSCHLHLHSSTFLAICLYSCFPSPRLLPLLERFPRPRARRGCDFTLAAFSCVCGPGRDAILLPRTILQSFEFLLTGSGSRLPNLTMPSRSFPCPKLPSCAFCRQVFRICTTVSFLQSSYLALHRLACLRDNRVDSFLVRSQSGHLAASHHVTAAMLHSAIAATPYSFLPCNSPTILRPTFLAPLSSCLTLSPVSGHCIKIAMTVLLVLSAAFLLLLPSPDCLLPP